MEVVLQLFATVLVYSAISWAIRDHPGAESLFATRDAVRRPWFSYGLLVLSGGLFLMVCGMAFSGWSEDPHPFTMATSILTVLAGGAVSLFGLLDRYVFRRQMMEFRSRRVRQVTETFVAGFILLPLTAIFSCSVENPRNSSGPITSPEEPFAANL